MSLQLDQYQPPDFLGSYLKGVQIAHGLEQLKQMKMETAEKQALISTGKDASQEAEQQKNPAAYGNDVDALPDAQMPQQPAQQQISPATIQANKLRQLGFSDAADRIMSHYVETKTNQFKLEELQHTKMVTHSVDGLQISLENPQMGMQIANEVLPDGHKLIKSAQRIGYDPKNPDAWKGDIMVFDQQHPNGVKENMFELQKASEGAQAQLQQRTMERVWGMRADVMRQNNIDTNSTRKYLGTLKPAQQQEFIATIRKNAALAAQEGDFDKANALNTQAEQYEKIAYGLAVKEGTGAGKGSGSVAPTDSEWFGTASILKTIPEFKDSETLMADARKIAGEAKFLRKKDPSLSETESIRQAAQAHLKGTDYKPAEAGSIIPPKFPVKPSMSLDISKMSVDDLKTLKPEQLTEEQRKEAADRWDKLHK